MSAIEATNSSRIRGMILGLLPPDRSANPRIFGPDGALDSLGLVNLLADLEYRLAEEFGREIVLASDRAMSRRQSPFRDVDALTGYILELMAE